MSIFGGYVVAAFALFLVFAACGDAIPTEPGSDSPEARLSPQADAPTMSARFDAPGAPRAIPFSNTFPGEDACTGEPQTTTIAGIIWVHDLADGNRVIRWERTITTDTGYEGRGVRTIVDNGNVYKLTNNDIVSHPDGRKFLAHGLMVLDLTTDPATVKVQMGGFRCIRG